MKQFITGHSTAVCRLAEALGIDPHKSRGFTIRVMGGEPVVLEIHELVEVHQIDALTTTILQYELKEKENGTV